MEVDGESPIEKAPSVAPDVSVGGNSQRSDAPLAKQARKKDEALSGKNQKQRCSFGCHCNCGLSEFNVGANECNRCEFLLERMENVFSWVQEW